MTGDDAVNDGARLAFSGCFPLTFQHGGAGLILGSGQPDLLDEVRTALHSD